MTYYQNTFNKNTVKTTAGVKPTTPAKTTTKATTVVKKEPVPMTPEQLKFQMEFLAQTQGRKYAPVAVEEYDKPVTIVTAGNGVFRVRKTPVALFITKLLDHKLPGVPDMEAGAQLLIPRIPMKYIIQILSFYREVNDQDGTEACANFYWNHNNVEIPNYDGLTIDGQLVLHCPYQHNSGAQTSFESGIHTRGEEVQWLRQNLAPLMETHSHNTMNAFWSGTDDANENYPQFYLVLGKVDKETIAMEFRWCEGDSKNGTSPSLAIEWPQVENTTLTTTIKKQTVKVLDFDSTLIGEAVVQNLDENHSAEKIDEVAEAPVVKTSDYLGPFNIIDYPREWIEVQHHTTPASTYYRTTPANRFAKSFGGSYGGDYYGDYCGDWDDWDNEYAKQYGKVTKKSQGLNESPNAKNVDHSGSINPYAYQEQMSLLDEEEEGILHWSEYATTSILETLDIYGQMEVNLLVSETIDMIKAGGIVTPIPQCAEIEDESTADYQEFFEAGVALGHDYLEYLIKPENKAVFQELVAAAY